MSDLTMKIKNLGREFILTSHTPIPDYISSHSRAFLFDTDNKLIPVEGRDMSVRGNFSYATDSFYIESPFLLHGGSPCYSQAHLELVYNGLLLAKKFGYDIAHFMTYDSDFDCDDIVEREELISSDQLDFVGFEMNGRLLADNYSLNLSLVDFNELCVDPRLMDGRLYDLCYDDTKYIDKFLISEFRQRRTSYDFGDKRLGSYETPKKSKRFEWLVLDKESKLELFINNNSSSPLDVNVVLRDSRKKYMVWGNTYNIDTLYFSNDPGSFTLIINGDLVASINLADEKERIFWVSRNIFNYF